ncbi:MAG TPA: hypothetical protein VF552_09685 [Allosphingosinicella sp.]|jgi:hypothetical protein
MESVDPLSAVGNGEGLLLLDAEAGWRDSRRIVCVQVEGSRGSCSSDTAAVVVDDYRHSAQVSAQWRKNDPNTIEVLVFGGEIARCSSPSSGARVILRQLPMAQRPSREGWDDITTRMFDGVRDSCASPV